jgi:hypothetical protein
MANWHSLRGVLFLTTWLCRMDSTFSFAPNQKRSCSTLTKSTTAASSSFCAPNHASAVLYSFLEQRQGESDIDFIKRITSQPPMDHQPQPQKSTNSTTAVTGTYQRIEEWDAQRKATGELTWEEKVQHEGQRFGNQVKQDSILRRHIGSFF